MLVPIIHRSDRPGREKTSSADRGPVDLYYYDGLARQEHLVRLTVNCSEFYERPRDEDLVPPLEHCIRLFFPYHTEMAKKCVLGCVILPVAALARSRNLGQTLLANSVLFSSNIVIFFQRNRTKWREANVDWNGSEKIL